MPETQSVCSLMLRNENILLLTVCCMISQIVSKSQLVFPQQEIKVVLMGFILSLLTREIIACSCNISNYKNLKACIYIFMFVVGFFNCT